MVDGKRSMPAHVALAERLGIAIATGVHPPGTVLPREARLAEEFGVARNVVREALRTIASKGLVESRPKAGTRVRERAFWNHLDPELLGWQFEGAPPLTFVAGLFQLRLIVEPAAAEIAAGARTASQLSRIGHALEEMSAHGLGDEAGRAADERFHAIILEATGNEVLVSLSASITAAVRWTTFFKYRGAAKPTDPMPQHRRVFEAIAGRDGPAARAATEELVRQAQVDTEAAMATHGRRAARASKAVPATNAG